MLDHVSNWLVRVSTGRVTSVAVIVFILFSMLVLPGQSASARLASHGAGSPDTSLLYSNRDLYRMAEVYGEQGRLAYVRARFTFDLVWPLVYTWCLVTTVSWLFARFFPEGSRWRWVDWVPLLAAALDYAENIAVSLVLLRYPARTPVFDTLAPVCSLAKWILVGGSFALLVLGAVIGTVRWTQRRHA